MRDVMFEIPSNKAISKCIITKDSVLNNEKAILVYDAKVEEKKEEDNKPKEEDKQTAN